MEIDRRALKQQAREAMKLAHPRFWLVTLVYLLATTGVSIAAEYLPAGLSGLGIPSIGFSSLFFSILLALYTTVVRFGFHLWSLWTHRRLDPDLGALIQGFSVSGRVIWMEIQIFAGTAVWSLVLAVAAGIPMGLMILFVAESPILLALLLGFWAVLTIVLSVLIRLRYCLAPYFLADRPDDGATAAVRRSIATTKGWKWELLKLEVSFWGWDILNFLLSMLALIPFLIASIGALFTMDLNSAPNAIYSIQQAVYAPLPYILSTLISVPLTLWLEPYRTVTRAGFYDACLDARQNSAPEL